MFICFSFNRSAEQAALIKKKKKIITLFDKHNGVNMYNDNLFQSRVHPSRKFSTSTNAKIPVLVDARHQIPHFPLHWGELRNNASQHFTSGRYIMTAQRWTV